MVQVYEEHLPDSFAAMLDMAQGESGPIVYFYCLSNPKASPQDPSYNAFAAAHHVVLDTSVPFAVVEVSLQRSCAPERQCTVSPSPKPQSYATKDTGTTNGSTSTRLAAGDYVSPSDSPEDEMMSLSNM